jgi:hypothetical protein
MREFVSVLARIDHGMTIILTTAVSATDLTLDSTRRYFGFGL